MCECVYSTCMCECLCVCIVVAESGWRIACLMDSIRLWCFLLSALGSKLDSGTLEMNCQMLFHALSREGVVQLLTGLVL